MILRKFHFISLFFFIIFIFSFHQISATPSYTYTGSSTLINDGSANYRIKFLTSGTFTPGKDMIIDAFLVGGGGGGGAVDYGDGGGGGYTLTKTNISTDNATPYSIVIGGGGAAGASGTASKAFGYTANPGIGVFGSSKGGNGGSGGAGYDGLGGTNGGNGTGTSAGTGQHTTTREFGNSSSTLYSTGGNGNQGGGTKTTGGANTGNGGGYAHAGGSGIVVIRFNDDTTAPTCGTWLPSSSPWKNAGTATFTLSDSTDTGGSGISIAGGSCTTSTVNGNTCTVTISDTAGNTRVCTSPVNRVDAVAPSGGSISYSATTVTSSTQSLSITVADGTDSESGINTSTRQLLRQEAVYSSGSCGSYGNPYSVSYSGTYPNITTSNFDLNYCYKYFWRIADNANNNTFYSSTAVVTATKTDFNLQDSSLGSIIVINNLAFAKITETGLLLALEAYPINKITTFSYTGAAQTFTVPRSGWYQIEAWGAAGGDARTLNTANLVQNSGGKGAYTSGKIYLTAGTTLTTQIGGKGGDQASTAAQSYGVGGYNGGGDGGTELNTETSPEAAAGGGGATDIRLVGGSWNDIISLRSRIMVAAGGGGAASHISGTTYPEAYGGSAGTLTGLSNSTLTLSGTQVSGAFGIGETGFSDSSGSNYGAYGGGGGGYYGGYWTVSNTVSIAQGGAGGSSFISGYGGVDAVISASSTVATDNILHYSNKYFIAGQMQAGVRSGNGEVKITFLGASPVRVNTALNNVRYIKDCVNENSVYASNQWSEIQAIKNGVNLAKEKLVVGTSIVHPSINSKNYATVVNGLIWPNTADLAQSLNAGLQCITIDLGQSYDLDEIAVWHYWVDGRTYYSNAIFVSSNNSDWTIIKNNQEAETANGKRISAYEQDSVDMDNEYIRYKNQIINSDFSPATSWSTSTSGWTSSSMTVNNALDGTVSNGTLYMSDTSSTDSIWNSQPVSYVAGHIYYLRSYIKTTSATTGGIYFGMKQFTNSTTTETIASFSYSPAAPEWVLKSAVFTPDYSTGYLSLGISLANIAKGYIKEIMLVDLTATFGAGNEPTKEWCDSNLTFVTTAGFSKIY